MASGVEDGLVTPLVDEGLGDSAYLVDLGNGRALVVDVPRDLRRLRQTLEQQGLRVAFAADTHLHADFLSGARQLGATDDARVLASAAGGREFAHVALDDGDEVELGGLTLRVLSTPGHTDEHLSFLLLDGIRPIGIFTGGSLIVGSAARTDLVDPDRTEELAHQPLVVLRETDQDPDEIAWQAAQIGYDNLVGEIAGGIGAWQSAGAPTEAVTTTAPTRTDGVHVLDIRQQAEFDAGHVPGAQHIELGALANRLDEVPHRPTVVMCGRGERAMGAAGLLARAGHHDLQVLQGGGQQEWATANDQPLDQGP